jgi:phospholipid/cholesterol/gamma-HCH transport system substrate-binding protein
VNSANIQQFSRNLAAFTGQLRASNGDLSGSLQQLPGFTNELNALVGQLQPTLPLLLSNLTATGQVFKVYLPNLRELLIVVPATINYLTAATYVGRSGGAGSVHGDFKMTMNQPPACQQGYQGASSMRSPQDTSPAPVPNQPPHCEEPHGSPIGVRDAYNDPCPNNPALRAATAAGCGLIFDSAEVQAAKGQQQGGSGSSPNAGASTYDPGTGLFFGPNGIPYSAGTGTASGTGPTTLSGLLQQTLGGGNAG